MKILLTGGTGYLGSPTVGALRSCGHEVATIGRHEGVDSFVCDLQDAESVRKAVNAAGVIDAVVHLAARAHDFRGLSLADLRQANVSTTRNLAEALCAEGKAKAVRFVHASSVAVYDILDTVRDMRAADAPYAASKLEAEHVVVAAPFQSIRVLRFAPVFDHAHLRDVAKRVYLPGTRLKVRLHPPPMHSLCSLELAVRTVVDAVEEPESHGTSIVNVAEPRPFSQHDLVGWFPGRSFPVPAAPLQTLADAFMLCGRAGSRLSHGIRKFVASTSYPVPTS